MANPGSNSRDGESASPEVASSPLASQEEGSQPQLPQFGQTQRSATPRGCRFMNLDEAHRNIMGRSASNNTTCSAGKLSSGADTAYADDIPLQDFSSPQDPGARPDENMVDKPHELPVRKIHGRSLTDKAILEVSKTRPPRDNSSPGMLSSPPIAHAASSTTTSSHGQGGTSMPSMPSDTSDNTVDRIYKQYQSRTPEFDGGVSTIQEVVPNSNGSQAGSSASRLPYSRDGAQNRCGFRSEEFDRAIYGDSEDTVPSSDMPKSDSRPDWISPTYGPPSAAPAVSLPSIPSKSATDGHHPSTHHGIDPNDSLQYSPDSVSNTQNLLDSAFEDAHEEGMEPDTNGASTADYHEMFPMPLRLHSLKNLDKHLSHESGTAASAGGTTSDSDDDPFRYDKKQFAFMRPSKEREVSAVLHNMSGMSVHSKGTICSPDGSPIRSPAFPKELAEVPEDLQSKEAGPYSRPQAGFFDPAAVRSGWEVGAIDGSPYEVKVVMQSGSSNNARWRSLKRGPSGPHDPHALNEENLNLGGFRDGADKDNTMGDRDEWETVATSGAGLGSTGLSFGPKSVNSRGIKVTGSSLADVSDDTSSGQGSFDGDFGSTDRIVQHPGTGRSPINFGLRNVQGSDMPIFVPKQRTHKVNGFAQNSGRIFSPQRTAAAATNAAGSLASKITNPFRRQLSIKRQDRYSPFPHYKVSKQSKFDFRTSQDLSYSSLWGRKEDRQRKTKRSLGVDKYLAAAAQESPHSPSPSRPFVPWQTPEQQRQRRQRPSGENDNSGSTPNSDRTHNFSFSLIPLPEAARRQAIRRASGQDDQTETGNARARRAMSHESSKKSHRTTATATSSELPQVPETPYQTRYQHPRHPRAALFPPNLSPTYARTYRRRQENENRARGVFPHQPSTISSSTATRSFGVMAALNSSPITDASANTPRSAAPIPPPRLYPWDYRHRGGAVDSQLRVIAAPDMEAGISRNPDDYLSYDAIMRRRFWFVFMLIISIFPFFSVLIYNGWFDSALSWYTRGEVNSLTKAQKKTIFAIMVAQLVLYPCVIVLFIWRNRFPVPDNRA